MSPRRYHGAGRRAARDETRRRILDAVIELHAEQGVTRTSYAMIAERADVAVPTVYNHFPAIGDLLAACSGDVLSRAPPLGPEIFAGAGDLESRLERLAHRLSAFYRYASPWLSWSTHEAVLVPEIAERMARMAEARRRLIEIALEPGFGLRPPERLVALCEILLDFPAWQRLARDKSQAPAEVAASIACGLIALGREHFPAAGEAGSAGLDEVTHRRSR